VSEEAPLRIFFSVGEASGDAHAAAVVRALKKIEPSAQIEALGGPELEKAGASLRMDFVEHAAMGLGPVIKKLPTFIRTLLDTTEYLDASRPDVVVPVDYPGFNLRLSKRCRARNIPVCYYVSPQVWAWRPGRIHRIGRCVDHMMVLFDFEVPLYRAIDVPVTFVGHPLFDELSSERLQNLRSTLDLPADRPLVGLLPGSRRQEISSILPEILEAAQGVHAKEPNVHFALPVARPSLRPLVDAICGQRAGGLPLSIFDGHAYEVMRSARAAITASGTATLQLAFFETPMSIVYKIKAWQKQLVLPLLGIGDIGLVNIVAGRRLCAEFLDSGNRAEDIAAETLRLLGRGRRRKQALKGLRAVRKRIGVRGTAERTAKCILKVAREHRRRRELAAS